MDYFGIWSVCWLLVTSFAMVGGQAESRGWTPPFTKWMTSTINKGSLNSPQNLTTFYIERVDKIEAESYALSQPACNDSPRMRSSFARPSLVINGSGSIIFERRAFTGAWGEILIINSKVKVMESEMFYNTSCLKKFTLEGNFIEEIKFKTLADGETQYLSMKSNQIQSIEHGAFQLSVTDSAHISSNRINVIQSEAFVLRTPRTFSFLNNTVGSVFSYAFQLAATESIDIKFSAFDHIARHAFRKIETVGNAKMTMVLSIKKFDKGALDLDQSLFKKSSLQFFEIQLDRDCDCELQVLVDTVFSPTLRRNASSKDDFNSVLRDFIFCRVRNESEKFSEFASSHHCQAPDVIMLVSITCAVVAILLLMAVAVTAIFRQKAKLRRTSVETSNGWVMHIYTETECQVKEEFTVPLESVSENGPEHDLLLLTANQHEILGLSKEIF
ncbi:hypothetical protein DAPPUDRAFT_252029 [Daphnia pulex]|uniref:Uncharacterized protein n=1 Tax=Daphnia pulex TaxID=6669 RepID=E9H1R8_DAPPU|nr:hypothetical protein DAPPUDRAFT_252029 [Daphnia pulex]|eukprot:EFX74220.1 hypothetical protein DAPPUDRAFT_252029 [Daphnia pulex]